MSNQLIVLENQIPKSRAKKLFQEFLFAWKKSSTKEKLAWSKDSLILFVKVFARRLKGFFQFIRLVSQKITIEVIDIRNAIYNKDLTEHLSQRASAASNSLREGYRTSKQITKNFITLLRTNPGETAPVLFLSILGFFVGAGFDRSEIKTWYDIDGGVPDLDIVFGGIGNHRSVFFHSIISAAVLESMIFALVNATKIIHSNLPDNYDPFWDKIVNKTDWATAFAAGACTGIAYHLLIDGTIDGRKAMTDFPFKMSMEGHNTFFVTNAIIEGLDVTKKGKV